MVEMFPGQLMLASRAEQRDRYDAHMSTLSLALSLGIGIVVVVV